MIEKTIVKKVLLEALKTGATFAELYIEDKYSDFILMQSSVIDDCNTAHIYGASIRILFGTEEIYGYTNVVNESSLLELASSLASSKKGEKVVCDFEFKTQKYNKNTVLKELSKDIENKDKIVRFNNIDKAARSVSSMVTQVSISYTNVCQNICVYNSLGINETDTRDNQRMTISVIVSNGEKMERQGYSYGGNFEKECFDKIDFEAEAISTAKKALVMLDAKEMKGGTYDVVIDNGFGGVIFHESCGHALEATSVAKNLSVFSNKKGEKIAASCVTAIDDGTISREWGSLNCDDEGHPTKKNVLIENGILKSYMIDYRNSLIMKDAPTGSARRQSYSYAPTSRMTNTYIAPGEYTIEEIIKNTKFGLYAKNMGGGSVNPATGEYNFSVSEAYMIEDGKITTPVRGATLIGNGKDTLLNIDMVGNELKFGYGMCGSLSGSIPVCVGQPAIRVKNLTVGGNG